MFNSKDTIEFLPQLILLILQSFVAVQLSSVTQTSANSGYFSSTTVGQFMLVN